ncbi:MAG: T9SS type A sorting domain-containing protein [Cytophagales bacterium]|nr:T9SS type A sorting domain-containing protein [Cytophagales bacterium]
MKKYLTLLFLIFSFLTAPIFAEELEIYPNPFLENTTLSYGLSESTDVSIQVYDALGNLLEVVVNETQQIGDYEYNLSIEKSGMYYLQFTKGTKIYTKRIIKS